MRRCLNCMEEYADNYTFCPHCQYIDGVTQSGDAHLQPGAILQGRYIVGTSIKRRKTDMFYMGWDALFERKVQIQEYFPEYCRECVGSACPDVPNSKQELFKEGLEFFVERSRQLIRLYKMEDVITYHACLRENGTAYAVMDFRQEETLDKFLESQTIRAGDARRWLLKAAKAVQKVHEIGICHGCVEPDSFWVRPDGSLILKDFGSLVHGEKTNVDVSGLAGMFCQMACGGLIETGERLEKEFFRRHIYLKRENIMVLKAALDGQIETVEEFLQDFLGDQYTDTDRYEEKRGRDAFGFPRWAKVAVPACIIGIIGLGIFGGAGPKKAVIPAVAGQHREIATDLLKEAGFTNIEVKEDTREGDYDTVLDINFEQGTEVGVDQKIILTVCVNKDSGNSLIQVKIPVVTGMDGKEAEILLKKESFRVRTDEVNSDRPRGIVIDQSPKGGEAVNQGACVTIHISKGPVPVCMKNVVLMSQEMAETAIAEMGLKVGEATKSYSDSVAEGKVIRQGIQRGTKIKKESQRREEEAARAKRQAEEARRREEEARRREEEARRMAEEARQREEEARRQQEAAESQGQLESSEETSGQPESSAEGPGQPESLPEGPGQSESSGESQNQPESVIQPDTEAAPKEPVESGQAPDGGTGESNAEPG